MKKLIIRSMFAHPNRTARMNVVTGIRLKRAEIRVELQNFRPNPNKFTGAVILLKEEK